MRASGKEADHGEDSTHRALSAEPEKSALFYERALGLKRVGEGDSPMATVVYLSGGYINLALIRYKTDEAAAQDLGKEFVGVHHFGFKVDDVEEAERRIEEHGGAFFMDLPAGQENMYYEKKFRDPDGIIFDLTHLGWVGASG
jgi:methylmalonyl-CoA/ethylmalonyl-CoA epimerase